MILGVAIFFILVLLFFLAVTLGNIQREAQASVRSGNILLISQLAGTPEFNCPDFQGDCVDTDKLVALINHPEYSKFWGVLGLRVEKVYPQSSKVTCNSVNYPNCNLFIIVNSTSANFIRDESYVSLCRREYQNSRGYSECELGKIIVESEKK